MTTQEQHIPALRFPEFSGEWEDQRLGQLFPRIRNGFVGTATPFYQKDGIAYLQGKNIKSGKIDPTNLVEISPLFHDKQKKSQLKENDILMVQSGHVGECAVVTKEYEGSNCHALVVMSPEKNVNSVFIKELFYAVSGLRQIYRITTGNTIKHILTSDLKPLLVKIPILLEQQKIASFLSSVDTKIEQLSTRKSLLEQYKKGMMQKLFSQEIRFKDEQGNEYPDWEEKRLKSIGVLKGGGTPDTNQSKYWAGEIPWVSSSDIFEQSIHRIRISRYINSDAISNSATKIIPKNSILIVSRVGVGKFAVNPEKVCTSQDFSNFTPNQDNVFFIAYWLLTHKNKLLSLCQGTSIKGLTISDLCALKIEIPIKDEQQKIADFLSAIDKKIELAGIELEKAQSFKKGLLQQMFI